MVATLSLIIIGGLLTYFCYLQIGIIKHSRDKNEILYSKILLILFIICNIYFYVVVDIRFPLDIMIIVGYLIYIGFFWIFHLVIRYVFNADTTMKDIDTTFHEEKGGLHEFLRKFFHFFTFGGCLLFVIIYTYATISVMEQDPNFGGALRNAMWEDSIFAPLNVDILYDPDIYWPEQMEIAMMVFFQLALPFAIIVENFRLDPGKEVPFHILFVKSLRESEQHNAAHYYFFIFGIFISTFFLPATCVFGILCVLCFGDTFASLVGKRVKKNRHPIKWEPQKCWEGAIAGLFFTFITALIFVGWFLAIVLGIIFIVFDAITPTKLKVSDNFIYPLVSILVLGIILYVFGFQIDALIGSWFKDLNDMFLSIAPELIL